MAACSRGTGTSTYDYARYSVSLLGFGNPLILCVGPRDEPLEGQFRRHFGNASVLLLKHWPTPKKLDPILLQHGVSDLYMQKWGARDATRSNLSMVRNLVHVSSTTAPSPSHLLALAGESRTHAAARRPHSGLDRLRVQGGVRREGAPRRRVRQSGSFDSWGRSDCALHRATCALSNASPPSCDGWRLAGASRWPVPERVRACVRAPRLIGGSLSPDGQPRGPDLRAELGIAADATVFGRHGGLHTFNIAAAKQAVADVSARRPDIVFVFMNTVRFCCDAAPNVIHLPSSVDSERKSRFIRTCDAMLHARAEGETFGLSVRRLHRIVANRRLSADSPPLSPEPTRIAT